MKNPRTLLILVGLIGVLSFIAAGVGVVWQGTGKHLEFKTIHAQTVLIQGDGLYKSDSVNNAAQAIAQDVVTLGMGLPLLLISMLLYQKNQLRGKLLLSGTLAYFLYTYTSYAFGAAYNSLFLVYVALFSLSLFALIFSIRSIEVKSLPQHFSSKLPRNSISAFLFVTASFLLVAWSGRIVPAMLDNGIPIGLENSTTLFIQVLDLGVIVPVGFLAGVLLLTKNPWGYLLSSIVVFKFLTMGTAVSAMVVGQMLAGVEIGLVEAIIFPVLAGLGIVMTIVLLINISEKPVPIIDGLSAFTTFEMSQAQKELAEKT